MHRRRTVILAAVLLAGFLLDPRQAVAEVAIRSLRNRPQIIAHRGASYDAPENTLAAVNLAWRRNADAVEIDVYLSKDRQIVVYHDETTKRIGGRDRRVKDQTLLELRQLDVGRWKGDQFAGERIPTLDQVLETVPPGKQLFIEIKDGIEIVPVIVPRLKRWEHTKDRAVVISFSYDVVQSVKERLPEIPVYWLVSFKRSKVTFRWQPKIGQAIARAKLAKLDGLNVNDCPVVTADAVARTRADGLGFFVWTVNDKDAVLRLRSLGVDGITTDRPEWIRNLVDR